MHEQNQIASTLASADGTERLKDLLAQAGSASRAEMGRRVCQALLFFSLFQWILPNYSMNSSGRCSNWFTTAGEN